jgi:hypothetical protein
MNNKIVARVGLAVLVLTAGLWGPVHADPAAGKFLLAFATPPLATSALSFAPPPGPSTEVDRPGGGREFVIQYDFNMLVMGRHAMVLTDIFDYADAVRARHIAVQSHRGASLLSDGTVLTEDEGLAEQRAREIADLLTGAGIDPDDIELGWSEAIDPPDGVEDWQSRRTIVVIEP